ncbi:sorbin and SH3 domain-containing protein 1 isoform X3 [Schistocerca piceifrons]|uniref:sorbin and SH3 domain-containing protein 1 isoform X3 n=1 Tax=Schistocerca piceifrons TaxID=274613 RepID=UPI001F5F11E6|nr:sorbin and SH3 domain-containing protein 1 isoform X3 [Schistocerca piceifrons]
MREGVEDHIDDDNAAAAAAVESQVNPGSKAAQKGVREGDVISSINGQSTRAVSNSDAHALLRNAGHTLRLGLNEECSGSPKRRNIRNAQQQQHQQTQPTRENHATNDSVKRGGSSSSSSTSSASTGITVKSADGSPSHSAAAAGENGKASPQPATSSADSSKGVWTPSPKLSSAGTPEPGAGDSQQQQHQQQVEGGDARNQGESPAPVPVWTPQASPTVERRHFRPVNFSPTPQQQQQQQQQQQLQRREEAQPESRQQQQAEPVRPPWEQQQQQGLEQQAAGSGRLVQSQSAPVGGLSGLALPRAPNPTVTLLQKAREGQLPRGALYLDHKMSSKESDKPIIGQNEILYSVKSEYEKEVEGHRKKIVELGPRKFEGIGPTTKDGIPIVLRSEVKDSNQAKWYKRMYDSLHRTGKDGRYPYTSPGGYLSEPEIGGYDSDAGYSSKYATLDRRRIKNKENDFTTSTLPRSKYVPHPSSIKYATEIYKNQPGRIEDYEPGHSSISEREAKQWWDEVLDIFDGWLDTHAPSPNYRSLLAEAIYQRQAANEQHTPTTPSNKSFMTYALKDGYESDSTLVFKRRDDQVQEQLSPAEQKMVYKAIQRGGEVPLQGLRKPAPQRPKESPHRYVESEVTIHYRSPVRSEAKEALSEEELARRQAEAMRRIYQEERRRKYLQELQDMHSRRHTDNFTPSQKSPIPLNRYDDFLDDASSKSRPRDKTPEPKLVARALYNFVGQTSRELSFRRGDIIFVRRQIDKNWYEGEHNAMVGLFPLNYVEIIPYDGIRTMPKKPTEGQAKAKFNFIAQTHLELSLVKGELVVLTRRVDENWYEGRIGNRKGIFPVSYVEVLQEPGDNRTGMLATPTKPTSTPTVHSVLVNGTGVKNYHQPGSTYYSQNKATSPYTSSSPYATLPRQAQPPKQPVAPVNQTLHIDTHSEPVPYKALYNYRPQNEDELELREGDTVYVMEKCDDGWYVGSSQRTGFFGTFPGNYVERL